METHSKNDIDSEIDQRDFLHEHIVKYRENNHKDLIVKAKLLDPASLDRAAELLYTYICMCMSPTADGAIPRSAEHSRQIADTGRILLLHAPSSAYSKGERAEDQVLAMLRRIRRMSIADSRPEHRDRIDVMPHCFILHIDKRNPQHEADRASRIIGARSKFRLLQQVPEILFQQFDQIFIIDDVSTTGHTLHALRTLLSQTYPALADRMRTLSIAH